MVYEKNREYSRDIDERQCKEKMISIIKRCDECEMKTEIDTLSIIVYKRRLMRTSIGNYFCVGGKNVKSRLPSEFRLQSSLFTSPQATALIRSCRRCEISTGVSASLFLNLNPTLPSADAARSPQLRSDAAECRRCETYHHSFFRLRSLFVAASQIESHRPPAHSHNESPIVFLPVSGSRGSCFLLLTPCLFTESIPVSGSRGSARPPSVSRLLVQMDDVNTGNRDDDDDDDDDGDCVEVAGVGERQSKEIGKRKRQKKQTSPVWNVFELLKTKDAKGVMVDIVIDGKRKAKCSWCGEVKNYDSTTGNGNLKRHIDKCYGNNTRDIGQMLLGKDNDSLMLKSSKINPNIFREKLVTTIIMHNLPLSFVDYKGIRNLFEYVSPELNIICRNTVRADIVSMHERETNKLIRLLKEAPGRICLTSDLWSSITTDGYISLTAHYVDKNWVLHKRLLNFSDMPPPHNGISLSEKVYSLLAKWGIEGKLFSITLDNASSNDTFVNILKLQLNVRKSLIKEGRFFHIRCCAHIVNLIVQDGLKEIDSCVYKVRVSVKYVKASNARKRHSLEYVKLVSLDSKRGLRQDVSTMWNSTYLMLRSALYFRTAFTHMGVSDSNSKYCPTNEEWDKIEVLGTFLCCFYEITCVFSGSLYSTSNLYFPSVLMARLTLEKHRDINDVRLKTMADKMLAKFEKYWSDFSLILAIAVVFDPRYKLQNVEWGYKKIYGENSSQFEEVKITLSSLFDIYHSSSQTRNNEASTLNNVNDPKEVGSSIHSNEAWKEFDSFDDEYGVSSKKSELELYLEEPRLPRKTKITLGHKQALVTRGKIRKKRTTNDGISPKICEKSVKKTLRIAFPPNFESVIEKQRLMFILLMLETVVAVSDGLKAWEVLKGKSQHIDLILTEVELPSISGFALLTLITEHQVCKNIPVISSSDIVSFLFCLYTNSDKKSIGLIRDFITLPDRSQSFLFFSGVASVKMAGSSSEESGVSRSLEGLSTGYVDFSDMKNLIGEASCRICQENFNTTVTTSWKSFDSFSVQGIDFKKKRLHLDISFNVLVSIYISLFCFLQQPLSDIVSLICRVTKAHLWRSVNILDYWRGQQARYPDLTAMARDILAIPVSIVASESAFSVGAKVIDKYRTAMKSDITEAPICTKDWMFGEDNYNPDDSVNEIVSLDVNEEASTVKSSTSTSTSAVDAIFWDYGLLFVFIRVVFVSDRHELKFVSCSCLARVVFTRIEIRVVFVFAKFVSCKFMFDTDTRHDNTNCQSIKRTSSSTGCYLQLYLSRGSPVQDIYRCHIWKAEFLTHMHNMIPELIQVLNPVDSYSAIVAPRETASFWKVEIGRL
ncbi:hypothetical protein LXL04_023082 [Taraxacum kok-saghyz]